MNMSAAQNHPSTPSANPSQQVVTDQQAHTDQKTNQPSLQGLTLRPVLTTDDDIHPQLAKHGKFPHHKYEKIVVEGIAAKMTTEEIVAHPLVCLLHDYKHLLLHGDRGNGDTRAKKRKNKQPFENHFCRLGLIYTLSQDPQTLDLNIKFVVSTAFWPIWTKFDGSKDRDMTSEDIVMVVANFIENYLVEAEQLIQSETAVCSIESITVVEVADPASNLAAASVITASALPDPNITNYGDSPIDGINPDTDPAPVETTSKTTTPPPETELT